MRLLLTTTALTCALSLGAVAQTTGSNPSTSQATPNTVQTTPKFMTRMEAGHWRASELIGMDVHGADNQDIGEVGDVLLDRTGQVMGVVIEVGGFLGIGESYVTVPMQTLQFAAAAPNQSAAGQASGTTAGGAINNSTGLPDRITLSLTKQQLEAAPKFTYDKRVAATADRPAATGTTNTPAGTGMTTPSGTNTTANTVTGGTASTTPMASGGQMAASLTSDEQNKLKQWIAQERKASVAPPSGTTVAVGSTLPQSVPLHDITSNAGVSGATRYDYAIVDNKTVLVEPATRKIVLVMG